MIYLYDEMPYLEGNRIILREFVKSDARALCEIANNKNVYKYLPTFLYEQKYEDKEYVIENMKKECFDTKESIIFAVCLKENINNCIGIGEIYNYEVEKEKASVGYRLNEQYWHLGYGTETCKLLRDYLLYRTDVRKITAHVICDNSASTNVLSKCGFEKKWVNLSEDWGFETNVIVDKYRYKISKEEKEQLLSNV